MTRIVTPMNREAWLSAATDLLRPDFADVDFPIPAKVAVSCGWPSSGGLASRKRTIGQCWAAEVSAAERPEVFISPLLADPIKVLGTLVHELVHASGAMGHGANFRRPAVALGLTGKMTATTESDELVMRLKDIATILGPYPHAALKPSRNLKVQTTRMLKVECGECGCVLRMTRLWLDKAGAPTCGCGSEMTEVF